MAEVKKVKRTLLYDNLRFALIYMVVLGHFLEPHVDDSGFLRMIFLLIYMVHMPMFFFLSGLLQKKYTEGRGLNINKVLSYVVIGYIYKMLVFLRERMLGNQIKFHMFWEDGIPWFMFVMAAFIVIMYLFRDANPKALMIFAILLACFAGYDKEIGDTLCLSRIIVYFPFYAGGYYLSSDHVERFRSNKFLRIASIVGMLVIVAITATHLDTIYQLRHLFTGRNPLNEWDFAHGGALLRLLCYAITTVLGASMLALIPKGKIPAGTMIGQQTMRIYFWHLSIIKVLNWLGYGAYIMSYGMAGRIVGFFGLAMILCLLLTAPIFGIPVDYVLRDMFRKKKI